MLFYHFFTHHCQSSMQESVAGIFTARQNMQVVTICQYDMDGDHGSKQVTLGIYQVTRRN